MPTADEMHRHGPGTVPLMPDLGSTPLPPPLPPPSGATIPGLVPPSSPRRHRWRTLGVLGALLVGATVVAIIMFPRARASFVADSLRVPDSIVAGETLDVAVDVRNTGDRSGEHEFTLLVDGASAASSTVELDAESAATLELTVTGLAAGPHEITIEGFDDVHRSFRVLTPAAFVIDELTVSQQQVDLAVDPVVTANVRFSNSGEATGSHVLELTVDGRPVEQRQVSLAGGESGEATFTLTMDTPGHPVVGVDGATAEVWVLRPAQLAIASVTVTPNPADLTAGNLVTLSANVSNSGDIDGTLTLEVSHDGSVIETRDVAVAAGQSIEQPFTVTLTHAGLQVFSVNGTQTELEVYQLERPADGAVLVNQFGRGGPNLLTIENQRDEDVYVVLTASGEGQPPLLGVYVHAGSTQTVSGIPGGTYATYFVHGGAWCTYYHRFTLNPDYGRFDDDSWFESTHSSYTEITLTFGSTEGWSPTSPVDAADFPA